jgi:hypothetical protein
MGQKELLRGKLMEMVKQGKRIYAACLSGGDRALVHGNAGKPSNRSLAEELKERAVKRYQERYSDFGLPFAADIPKPEGAVGLFWELLQFEGSHHDWFEGRRGRCCLITITNDTTNIRVWAAFRGGDDGGSDDGIVLLDKEIRDTASLVLRPQERLCADPGGNGGGTFAGDNQTEQAFWECL